MGPVHPPMLVPNTRRAKRCGLQVGTANITSWASFKKYFELSGSDLRGGHVWAVQEHRLVEEQQLAQAQSWLQAKG